MAKLLLSFLFFILALNAKAQHPEILGSHISYRAIDTLTYEVKLTVIRECSGDLNALNDTLILKADSLEIKQKPTFISKKNISPIGENCNLKNICDSGTFPYGFEERIYIDTFSLVNINACDIYFVWTGNKRYSGITTGAANENHYNYAYLNYCTTKFNSSYIFTSTPKIIAYEGQNLIMGIRSVDTLEMNDSILHFFESPKISSINNQSFSSPYDWKSFVTYLGGMGRDPSLFNFPAGIRVDTVLSNVYLRPMKAGEQSIFCVESNEFRKINGKTELIGITRWDMALIIVKSPLNKVTNNTINFPPNNFLCANTLNEFNFESTDADTADSARFRIDYSGYKNITFSDTFITKDQTINIRWQPTSKEIRTIKSPYIINLTTYDNNCDVDGVNSLNIPFYLDEKNMPKFNIKDSVFCKGSDAVLRLNISDTNKIKNIMWDNIVSDSFVISNSEIPKNIEIKVTDTNSCEQIVNQLIDTFPTLNLNYKLSNNKLCENEDALLTVNFEDSNDVKNVIWNDSISSDSFKILSQNIPTTLKINVIDKNGCSEITSQNIKKYPKFSEPISLKDSLFCDAYGFIKLDLNNLKNIKKIVWDNLVTDDSFFVSKIPSSVQIQITDTFGCNFSTSKFIDTFPKVKPEFLIPDSICFNSDSIILKAIPSNGIWGGNSINDSIFYPSKNYKGFNNIEYNFTNAFQCKDISSHNLFVNYVTEPEVYINPDTGIIPLHIYFNEETFTNYDSYLWEFSNSQFVYKTRSNNDKILLRDTGSFDVKLTVTKDGCSNFIVKKNRILVHPKNYVDIKNSQKNRSIFIFPNPAKSLLSIDLKEITNNISYKIFDVNGKEILEGNLENTQNNLDINMLNAGFYFIEIYQSNSNIFRTKFIKE